MRHLSRPVLARIAKRSLVCFSMVSLVTTTAVSAKPKVPTRALKLPKSDDGCAVYSVERLAGGARGLLAIKSKCAKVKVEVCTFKTSPPPAVWDCQQLAFKTAGETRRMPYAQPVAALYYVGACVRQNWDCNATMDWFYSRLVASTEKLDPLTLKPPPPPPPPPLPGAERG